jgi:hypothetical protein
MSEEIKGSIYSIYSKLINQRKEEKEKRKEEKNIKKAEEKAEKQSEDKLLTKKEKREIEFNSWNDIVKNLVGDDLEYINNKKSNKKKYKKWIDEDTGNNVVLNDRKQKRKKKRNYSKEFEPELNMLKSIVGDQNKFVNNLQKRYDLAAGPNTKDSMPLNKNLIELASVINMSRGNSLGLLREIGTLKKHVADLYNKQKEFDYKYGGTSGDLSTNDMELFGSTLANNLFGSQPYQTPIVNQPVNQQIPVQQPNIQHQMTPSTSLFNPDEWNGGGIEDNMTKFEAIPHKIVVEWHKNDDKARFKAIRNDNGEELIGAPLPTCEIKNIDTVNNVAKDSFDQVYQIEVIE